MFKVDARYQVELPFLLAEENSAQHWVIEQCFNHPLWQIQVLSPTSKHGKKSQFWTRLLVTSADHALGVLLGEAWECAEATLVVPGYMNGSGGPVLAKCIAIWECEDVHSKGRTAWLVHTDQGDFMDPYHGVQKVDFKAKELKWQSPPQPT
ncbi:hypothetical protein [Variovorax sp. OV329]|uniref:hypothetical protein n=1 Tax=Variovorax sp. OV329 TaxID=1882825 RepID=UPI0011136822|nr:hypothetical protein [Variovorax sp. OV329]